MHVSQPHMYLICSRTNQYVLDLRNREWDNTVSWSCIVLHDSQELCSLWRTAGKFYSFLVSWQEKGKIKPDCMWTLSQELLEAHRWLEPLRSSEWRGKQSNSFMQLYLYFRQLFLSSLLLNCLLSPKGHGKAKGSAVRGSTVLHTALKVMSPAKCSLASWAAWACILCPPPISLLPGLLP